MQICFKNPMHAFHSTAPKFPFHTTRQHALLSYSFFFSSFIHSYLIAFHFPFTISFSTCYLLFIYKHINITKLVFIFSFPIVLNISRSFSSASFIIMYSFSVHIYMYYFTTIYISCIFSDRKIV